MPARVEEPTDKLGFTPSDYERMQSKTDEEKTTFGDWDITAEMKEQINDISAPLHYTAVVCFFDANYKHLLFMAYGFLRKQRDSFRVLVEAEDLVQQVFVDLSCGYLKLPYDNKKIAKAICTCYRFTPVGGLEGLDEEE
jgi:hypothetical protein